MCEPVKMSWSEQELQYEVRDFMLERFGRPSELTPEQRDSWYERAGIMADFVGELFRAE